jgi:hypothetical protein
MHKRLAEEKGRVDVGRIYPKSHGLGLNYSASVNNVSKNDGVWDKRL